jgi:histone H3/H4
MSNTRHATPGDPFRQERFASSYEQGLLANLVAKRCSVIDPAQDREAIWFAQWRSWNHGGLESLASEMLRRYDMPEWRASFGAMKPGLNALLEYLYRTLADICLSPGIGLGEVWESLDDYRRKWIGHLPVIAETAISRKVWKAMQYTRSQRTLTLIDGHARIGKSFAARAWCESTAGMARYVQVPSSSDEVGFFRVVGRSLGISSSLQMKAAEMRARIEDVLQGGDLMVVFDEAHYLWPQNWQRYATPSRVNWIMTALVNYNVPVALVTTPQFYTIQKRVENLTGWASEQFIGRIGHVERLPDKLSMADLETVAKAMMPGADDATLESLAAYAALSKKHLASIEAIVKRARWIADQAGRKEACSKDVQAAMKESAIPSDNALTESLSAARKTSRKHGRLVAASARPAPVADDDRALIDARRGGSVLV